MSLVLFSGETAEDEEERGTQKARQENGEGKKEKGDMDRAGRRAKCKGLGIHFLCQGVKVLKDNCQIELHLQVLCSLLVHIRPLLISYSPAACTCSAPLHHHPKGSTGKKR